MLVVEGAGSAEGEDGAVEVAVPVLWLEPSLEGVGFGCLRAEC